MTDVVQRARAFAVKAHADQRYGDAPYVVHLDAVVALLSPYDEAHRVAGYLHDAVEDTPATVAEIEAQFGGPVARWVALLTDEPGSNRKERKAKTYAKLANVVHPGPDSGALVVKAADRLANVRACGCEANANKLAMYRAEHAAFRAAAYHDGLCDALWLELAERLVRL